MHVPWCMSGSLTRMRNPQFCVSGKRPMRGDMNKSSPRRCWAFKDKVNVSPLQMEDGLVRVVIPTAIQRNGRGIGGISGEGCFLTCKSPQTRCLYFFVRHAHDLPFCPFTSEGNADSSPHALGAVSIRKTVLPGMAIPMLKIRRPNGRLIFNMESPYVDKTVFILRRGPGGRLNKKDGLTRYGDSHVKDKTS